MIPLPADLSGVVMERVVRLDSALFYLTNGALSALLDFTRYAQTGTLTPDATLAALDVMLERYYALDVSEYLSGARLLVDFDGVPFMDVDGVVLYEGDYG